jgi:hypothetical protein
MSAFDFSTSMGYWVGGLVIVLVLFGAFALFGVGFKMSFYSSDYGTDLLNLEESIFSCYEYVDPVTGITYPRILDETLFDTVALTPCLEEAGYGRKGVAFNVTKESSSVHYMVSDYYTDTPKVSKAYPILLYVSKESLEDEGPLFVAASLQLEFSNP